MSKKGAPQYFFYFWAKTEAQGNLFALRFLHTVFDTMQLA